MAISWKFSKTIAFRYLWSKRSEAFITLITIISILGVAIGVAVLNITMAIMTGFQFELKNRIVGANSHILVRSLGGAIHEWEVLSKQISELPGVQSVSPYTQSQALIRVEGRGANARSAGVLIRGVKQGTSAAQQLASYMNLPEPDLPIWAPEPLRSETQEGETESLLPALVLGKELQRTLGVFVGTPVSLLSPQVTSTPFGLMPRFRRFLVAGTYSSGLIDYESGLAYAKLEDCQKFFDFGKTVSGFEIRVENIDESSSVTNAIASLPGAKERGIYAQDWTETNRPLWEALKFERRVYFIVLLLIIVMASFSIITTLIMLVLEKRKDIAIMRTMGANAPSIGMTFFIQGATIGLLGTVSGIVLGFVGCQLLRWYGFPLDERIFQMSTVPVHVEPINFIVVGLSAFFICCLATIYPSFRASRLHPSEVLRYE